MKKFIQKILLALACFMVGFGFTFAQITVSAETLDNSSESTVVDGSQDNQSDETQDKVETTFDDFLAWAQQEADRYGYGEDFAGAISAIKAAATQEQVTLSTIASGALAFLILAYIVVKHVKDKGYKKALVSFVKKFDEKVDSSIKGTNALIDGENAMLNNEAVNGKITAETKAEVQSLKKCLRLFISAFLRFTDGVKLGDNKKTEVQSNLLSALKEIDDSTSEGVANENNEK